MLGVNRSFRSTSHVGSAENSDMGRRVHNMIRYGVVEETDYPKGLVRICMQQKELKSNWLPWVTLRGGPGGTHEGDRYWWAPEIGEAVLVFAPSGEMATGFVFPALFSNQNQPADRETVQRTVFKDGAIVEYDREMHRYLIDLDQVEGEPAVAIRAKNVIVHSNETVNIASSGPMILNGDPIYLNTMGDLDFPEATDVLEPLEPLKPPEPGECPTGA